MPDRALTTSNLLKRNAASFLRSNYDWSEFERHDYPFNRLPHKVLLQFVPFPKQGKRNYKAVPSPLSPGNKDLAIRYASFGVNLI